MRRRVSAHHPHCVGCGEENAGSHGLRFEIDRERAYATCRLDERHQGAPGFAHGGAVATVLDDTLGTLLVVLRRPAVTAKLEVNYRSPAFLGRDFAIEAWIERVDGRKLYLRAEMREDGKLIADATALFLEVDIEHFAQGGNELPDRIREHWGRGKPDLPY